MSATGTIRSTATVAGVTISSLTTRTAEGMIGQNVALAASKAGTLSTRTSNSVGEATLASGHGITTGLVVDVYWTGGVRYGVTVGTVDGTVVPLSDSGAGDNYPVEDSAIVVAPVSVINADVDADDFQMITVHSAKRAHVAFIDSGDAVLAAVEVPANEMWSWVADAGIANPLTGNAIDEIHVSNGDSSAATTVKIGILYDSVA